MMSILDSLGPWLPLVVFLATFFESAAFAGLVVPGETVAVVAGAAAAIRGDGPGAVLAAAVVGAVAGDAIGFGLGRRYGQRITDHPRLLRFRERLERARAFVEKRGVWSLVLARFVSVLRAVVPFSAGTSGMPYPTFFVGNVIGGILWGTGVAGLGYAAGTRWHVVEAWLGRIGITMAVVGALVAIVVLSARWIARHPARTRELLRFGGRVPVIGWLLSAGIDMLTRPRTAMRVVTHVAVATVATGIFVVAGLIDWSFVEGRVLLDILGADAAVRDSVARAGDALVPLVAAIVILGVVAGGLPWVRLILIVASAALTALIAFGVSSQVHRPSVDLPGLGAPGPFPDIATGVTAALVLAAAWPLTRGWASGARVLGAALAAVLTIAGVHLVSLQVRPVDTVAGVALGLASVVWVATIIDPRLGGSPLPGMRPPVDP